MTSFDKHRAGTKGGRLAGECYPPSGSGLVKNGRGIWQTPGEVDIRERFQR